METTSEKIDLIISKLNKLIPDEEGDDAERSEYVKDLERIKAEIILTLQQHKDEQQGIIRTLIEEADAPVRDDIGIQKRLLRQIDSKINDLQLTDARNRDKAEAERSEPDEDDPDTVVFIRRRNFAVGLSVFFTALLSIGAFKFFLPAFPIVMGLFVTLLGVAVMLYLDEYLFEGYSIGKIGSNAISLGLVMLAIGVMYFTGALIGNSYISNPFGSETEKQYNAIETVGSGYDATGSGSVTSSAGSSSTRGSGVKVLQTKNSGKAESEQ